MIRLTDLLKEDAAENELKSILKQNYKTFVEKLGDDIKDPKFLAAVKSFSDDFPIETQEIEVDVSHLRPTQNEIVLKKSLHKAIIDPELTEKFLKGGVVSVDNKLIVTANNGRYIIDGHHRWARVFCLNPDAKIKALDLVNIKDPFDALKAVQIGVAAKTGEVPTEHGGGVNLFKIDKLSLKKYVIDELSKESKQIFKSYGKGNTRNDIANFIWKNLTLLQKTAEPITNAPERDLMPQTDKAPDFVKNTFDVSNVSEMSLKSLFI